VSWSGPTKLTVAFTPDALVFASNGASAPWPSLRPPRPRRGRRFHPSARRRSATARPWPPAPSPRRHRS